MMEHLKYIVEDSTIAELLGVQNFTNKESAILELVKNSYDSHAGIVTISFKNNALYICRNDAPEKHIQHGEMIVFSRRLL